jgi:glycosyltransferase involved in cell wall biosynthesis
MRIGIDARTILNPEQGDAIGTGHYTYQLIRHLLNVDKENEYVLFFDFRVREKDIKKFSKPNVKIRFYPFSDYKKYLPGIYNEILGVATLNKEKLDVLHSPSHMSRIPTGYSGKTVVTINDLTALKIPEVLPKVARARSSALLNLMTSKADKIIAVSNSIKKDIVENFKHTEEKIEVVYSGFDKRLFAEYGNTDKEKILNKYEIKDKYILFLGTLEPAKNIVRLLEAFKIFKNNLKKEKIHCDYKLVLAGKRGWLANEYKQIAKDLGINKSVVFTGYVIGDELVPLFQNSEFFVLPSLYEGFGSTILEAFATGTPVMASNVSSIPEIAGDAAILVNPIDILEIAENMMKLAKDENLRNMLREKGKKQLEKFNWEKCAQETLAVYSRAYNQNK